MKLTMPAVVFFLVLPLYSAISQTEDSSRAETITWVRESSVPGVMLQTPLLADTLTVPSRATALAVGSEVLLGATVGGLGAVIVGVGVGRIAAGFSSQDSWDPIAYAVLGAGAGYVLGSSLGVHGIARRYNPNSSYTGTLFSGLIGMGMGVAIYSAGDRGKARGSALGLVLLPVLCEVVFVNVWEQPEAVPLQHSEIPEPVPLSMLPLAISMQKSNMVAFVVIEW